MFLMRWNVGASVPDLGEKCLERLMHVPPPSINDEGSEILVAKVPAF
jgi:hypothetical protein